MAGFFRVDTGFYCHYTGPNRRAKYNGGIKVPGTFSGREFALSSWKGINLFLFDQFSCIGEAGVDVVTGQVVVFLENLFDGPATSEQIDDELHGDAGAFDNRLAHKDVRVYSDAFAPVHIVFPAPLTLPAAGRARSGGELMPSVYTGSSGIDLENLCNLRMNMILEFWGRLTYFPGEFTSMPSIDMRLRCRQRGQVGPLERGKAKFPKHTIQRRQGKLVRRDNLDPNRLSITCEINDQAWLNAPGSIALVCEAARQVVVRSHWPAMAKRDFQI
jgi:hypothetical protein